MHGPLDVVALCQSTRAVSIGAVNSLVSCCRAWGCMLGFACMLPTLHGHVPHTMANQLKYMRCCCHLQTIAKSFGFATPPRVNLNIESKAAHGRKAKKAAAGADYRRFKPQSGHAFSASNPYGVRDTGDRRQLTRY
eukprot:GHRR01030770.1.p1 GENE.GHRR01030770.1~~GHRR01030770.1.p1  ORF type:complete len:136 (-),score=28.87 GHRR01030770.1:58-465(-)